ncbi:type II toxin-antitoxin system HicB family antitoxin [Desulfonema magnum]|uniref:Toxin-antitoxin system, antitoxin component, HicB domain-containing protein n=1 Tax=Desulfonema magnum TaxID=45655 RepID=A0A975GPI2_9BACT|nr:type II toxin-antitoxin system HicB family antitoxin [Desulfonema magnum]QTA88859.1 Toxin-antitoxin system, antitoxin component, HicB domain-containing protein [Desulfonema magnum]
MLKKHYPIIIEQDSDGVFIVECPVFRGCRSYGHTMSEALENIREAVELCIEDEQIHEEISTTFIGVRDLEVVLS